MKCLTVLAVTQVLTGCASTYELAYDPGNVQLQEAIANFKQEHATLTLCDGTFFEGSVENVMGNTLEFQWEDIGVPFSVTLNQVRSIKLDSKPFPAVGLGILVGATAGALIGNTVPHNKPNGVFDFGPDDHDVAIGLGVVFGGIVGGTVGHAISRSPKLTLTPAERTRAGESAWESIAIFVPEVTLEGDYVSFVASDNVVSFAKRDLVIERTREGTVLHVRSQSLMLRPPGKSPR